MKKMLNKLPELMQAPEFAKAYQESSQEFALACEIIKTRAHTGLSQKELAQKIDAIQNALIAGEESGEPTPFDNDTFLKKMRIKYAQK